MEDLCFDDLDKSLLKSNGRIIHHIWFGTIPNKRCAKKALEGLKKYKDSWITLNPTWTYVCWSFKLCDEFIKRYYKQHIEMYNNYPHQIQKCDAVRYFILHRYGGLYTDMDYYCNKPWDDVLLNYTNDIYFVETPNKIGEEIHISNSLMYSTPGHVFWNKLFIELEKYQTMPLYYGRHMTIMFTTGPGILNRVYNQYKNRYKLDFYPYKLFHPYGLNTDIITLNNKTDIYAFHIGKGSWETNDSKWIIFIYKEYRILLFIILILILPSILYRYF